MKTRILTITFMFARSLFPCSLQYLNITFHLSLFSKTFTFNYASPGNSVIAAALLCASGIHRESNHGSTRSRYSSNHGAQMNSHMQEPIRTYYIKPW